MLREFFIELWVFCTVRNFTNSTTVNTEYWILQCIDGYLSCCNQKCIRILAPSVYDLNEKSIKQRILGQPCHGFMNQKRIFNPLSFLQVRKKIVELPCGVYTLSLSTSEAFGQFQIKICYGHHASTLRRRMNNWWLKHIEDMLMVLLTKICRMVYLHDYL